MARLPSVLEPQVPPDKKMAYRDGGYISLVQLGQTALPWLSDEDRSWIMGETAHKFWPMLRAPALG